MPVWRIKVCFPSHVVSSVVDLTVKSKNTNRANMNSFCANAIQGRAARPELFSLNHQESEVLIIVFSTAAGIVDPHSSPVSTDPHLCLRGLCHHSSWWALLWKYHPGPGSRLPCRGCYGAPSHPPPDAKQTWHTETAGVKPLTNHCITSTQGTKIP